MTKTHTLKPHTGFVLVPREATVGMVPRALNWGQQRIKTGRAGVTLVALSPSGHYKVHERKSGAVFASRLHSCGYENIGEFDTLEAAKSACQADFEARLSQFLVPHTAMIEAAQPKTLEDVKRELIKELIEKAEAEEAKFFDTDEYQHREHERDLDVIEHFGLGPLYWLRKQLKEDRTA